MSATTRSRGRRDLAGHVERGIASGRRSAPDECLQTLTKLSRSHSSLSDGRTIIHSGYLLHRRNQENLFVVAQLQIGRKASCRRVETGEVIPHLLELTTEVDEIKPGDADVSPHLLKVHLASLAVVRRTVETGEAEGAGHLFLEKLFHV